jgi:hypothetical protein
MERRFHPRAVKAAGGLVGLLAAVAAAHPGPALAQNLEGLELPAWTAPQRPDWQRSAEPKVERTPEQPEPDPSAGLRVTPADAQRLEHELSAIRDRLLELRSERSRLNDELRQLGDVHGSLDEALWGHATSGFRAGRARQDVEERERAVGSRQASLEEEERTLTRTRIHLERLLRELQRLPEALPHAIS